jgi:YidC/Oxa1 family membrane protein insertase
MNIFTTLLVQPLANGLIIFYRLLFDNLGLAIIGFSLFLRFVLNPLTKPYMESMKKMKEVAPQLEKLKKKHKEDKIKLAQAQADLYKEKGVNPGAGCLPYLLQIIILIAFFNVFSVTLTKEGNITENFNKVLYEGIKFKEGDTLNDKFLYLNLSKQDCFGPDTDKRKCVADPFGLPFALPGLILVLASITQLLSVKVMSPQTKVSEAVAGGTKGKEDDMQVMMQKSMSYTFPLMTLLIGMNFPSGLALYWFIFSGSQYLQQKLINTKKIN